MTRLVLDHASGRILWACDCAEPVNLPLDGVSTHGCACGVTWSWDGARAQLVKGVPAPVVSEDVRPSRRPAGGREGGSS